jgi:hypothetical protein
MTAKKQLTEPQAWREIARRIAEGEWLGSGLCSEADNLEYGRLIPSRLGNRMYERAERHVALERLAGRAFVGDYGATYAFPPGKNADERVLAALFLALEAEDDEQ